MKYEKQQFFSENQHDSVKGFTVLQAKDGKYHIAEKWLKEDGDDKWMDYWVPESDLHNRTERGDCEPAAMLTDEQFEGVCKKVGWRYDTGEAQVEA
jgi:hypothetical protein